MEHSTALTSPDTGLSISETCQPTTTNTGAATWSSSPNEEAQTIADYSRRYHRPRRSFGHYQIAVSPRDAAYEKHADTAHGSQFRSNHIEYAANATNGGRVQPQRDTS